LSINSFLAIVKAWGCWGSLGRGLAKGTATFSNWSAVHGVAMLWKVPESQFSELRMPKTLDQPKQTTFIRSHKRAQHQKIKSDKNGLSTFYFTPHVELQIVIRHAEFMIFDCDFARIFSFCTMCHSIHHHPPRPA